MDTFPYKITLQNANPIPYNAKTLKIWAFNHWIAFFNVIRLLPTHVWSLPFILEYDPTMIRSL